MDNANSFYVYTEFTVIAPLAQERGEVALSGSGSLSSSPRRGTALCSWVGTLLSYWQI